ncbi:MAG: trimethylamine methyltransferase family protein [Lachnospiraceae bacterium]|nr:trimethylamine methyltransferase family protein [Lachnospiraceae bacterium]
MFYSCMTIFGILFALVNCVDEKIISNGGIVMHRYHSVSQNEIEQLHETTLKLIEDVGILMPYEPARNILAKAGAKIDGKIVHFTRKMVEDAIKSAPSSFVVNSKNPKRNMAVSTESQVYSGPGGACYVSDLDYGRRPSLKQDFINFAKLEESLENYDFMNMICELNDVPLEKRFNEMAYLAMKYSDKPFVNATLGYDATKEFISMYALPHGGIDNIEKKPVCISIVCTVTPLAYDEMALGALMAYAEYGQPLIVNSLCMSGATSPVTIPGSIVIQNAEVLAGITLAQLINPGTPVIYGADGTAADLKSGTLAIGAPESAIFSLMNGQLAKYYNLPCRLSGAGLTDSKCVDAQAGYEAMMNLVMAEMAGGNVNLCAGGVLETYNVNSYEKLVLDNEMIGMVKRICKGVEVNDETLAYDVIKEVGIQGEYLSHPHTFMNFRDVQYIPQISSRGNYRIWEESGSLTAEQRANAKWKQLLEEYVQPEFSKELDMELRKFIDK